VDPGLVVREVGAPARDHDHGDDRAAHHADDGRSSDAACPTHAAAASDHGPATGDHGSDHCAADDPAHHAGADGHDRSREHDIAARAHDHDPAGTSLTPDRRVLAAGRA
jgi:hypothetical protein